MTVGFSGEEASPRRKEQGTAQFDRLTALTVRLGSQSLSEVEGSEVEERRAPAVNGHGQRIAVTSFLCFIRH
ncbi:MAG: hypothetical protein A2W07_02095 [candidate division Zixibacteria bacterium RBG_16_43_9]|nr:MAG: hypothetical protein A2W07_02095 [candidate division Zixibacteria bacterium RBG_16_43_9]